MATATLSPAEVSARRLAAVTEELTRNGIEVPRESVIAHDQAATLPVEPRGLQLIPRRVEDFRSAPYARPMGRNDINNVAAIDHVAAGVILEAARSVNPMRLAAVKARIEEDWQMLLSDAERVVLTALAWRKLEREESATV